MNDSSTAVVCLVNYRNDRYIFLFVFVNLSFEKFSQEVKSVVYLKNSRKKSVHNPVSRATATDRFDLHQTTVTGFILI